MILSYKTNEKGMGFVYTFMWSNQSAELRRKEGIK